MTPFTTLQSAACPLAQANIDTDQIIPARFMSRPRDAGYGDVLFHDLRLARDRDGLPSFPLDRHRWKGAQILVARRNFAAGSSREAAVYALMDFGIRAVIAPSFSDIFAGNAVSNGLLLVALPEETVERLLAAASGEEALSVTIDLAAQTVTWAGTAHPFEIDPVRKLKLLNGWDDLDLTLSHSAAIDQFFAADRTLRPWALPVPD
jgi:3-isopropylmalate/(R)-2-methylmalate dehydratase small subunit